MAFVCPLCDESNRIIPDINEEDITAHLLVTVSLEKNRSGKGTHRVYHVHGPVEDKPFMREFVKMICKEAGIEVEE